MLETKIGRRDALRGVAIGAWAIGLAAMAVAQSFMPLASLAPQPVTMVQAKPAMPVAAKAPPASVVAPEPLLLTYGPQLPMSHRGALHDGRRIDCLAALKASVTEPPSNT